MLRRFVSLVLLALLLGACGGPSTSTGTVAEQPIGPTASAALRPVTVGMSYIPNVQFAHFYLAQQRGYYAAEGLEVTFDYNFETDVVPRVAQGTVQFGLAGGDSVLLARAQGLPVMTVMTNSQRFPIVLFSKAEQAIQTPQDLRGKSVGIPGRFGGTYIGLRALLYASQMQESDLAIQEIGFTQLAAVSEDRVQVGVGYGNNEPLQLEAQGVKLNVLRVSDYYPLVSDGLITSDALLAQSPELARGFVRATLRGMRDTINEPDAAFAAALTAIPELSSAPEEARELQRKVLQATLPYWQSETTELHGLGYSDAANWEATVRFLRDSALLRGDVDITKAFTNEYLE